MVNAVRIAVRYGILATLTLWFWIPPVSAGKVLNVRLAQYGTFFSFRPYTACTEICVNVVQSGETIYDLNICEMKLISIRGVAALLWITCVISAASDDIKQFPAQTDVFQSACADSTHDVLDRFKQEITSTTHNYKLIC